MTDSSSTTTRRRLLREGAPRARHEAVAWRSVHVPRIMPKPDVVALTGGYRRTPFMQIGADIYCDSALMCRVIDRLWPEPSLYPAATAASPRSSPSGPTRRSSGARAVHDAAGRRGASLRRRAARGPQGLRRRPRGDEPAMRRAPRPTARPLVAYLTVSRRCSTTRGPSCSARCRDRRLLGDAVDLVRAPRAAGGDGPRAYPKMMRWTSASPPSATASRRRWPATRRSRCARGATSFAPAASRRAQAFAAGDAVRIAAADYAHDEILGTVVGLDHDEVVIERRDARAGTVHVHFPRIGFHVKASREGQRMKRFADGTAVITGAASGFGLEASRLAARRGMNVVMADVQADALERAAGRSRRSARRCCRTVSTSRRRPRSRRSARRR